MAGVGSVNCADSVSVDEGDRNGGVFSGTMDLIPRVWGRERWAPGVLPGRGSCDAKGWLSGVASSCRH